MPPFVCVRVRVFGTFPPVHRDVRQTSGLVPPTRTARRRRPLHPTAPNLAATASTRDIHGAAEIVTQMTPTTSSPQPRSISREKGRRADRAARRFQCDCVSRVILARGKRKIAYILHTQSNGRTGLLRLGREFDEGVQQR